jgi:hypothetical protein
MEPPDTPGGFTSLCQVDLGVGLVGFALAGSGSELSEESVVGVEPAALDVGVAPWCPPRGRLNAGVRVAPKAAVNGVGELSF